MFITDRTISHKWTNNFRNYTRIVPLSRAISLITHGPNNKGAQKIHIPIIICEGVYAAPLIAAYNAISYNVVNGKFSRSSPPTYFIESKRGAGARNDVKGTSDRVKFWSILNELFVPGQNWKQFRGFFHTSRKISSSQRSSYACRISSE